MKYIINNSIDLIPADDGAAIIFDAGSGSSHVLDSVAVDIINILKEEKTLDEIILELSKMYDTNINEIKTDVDEFLKDLIEKKIVTEV